jgi:hypothetical protein
MITVTRSVRATGTTTTRFRCSIVRLLEDLPEVLERFVLPALGPTALALLARVDRGWLAVVVWSSSLLRAGLTEEVPLKVKEFCRATHLGQSERVPIGDVSYTIVWGR